MLVSLLSISCLWVVCSVLSLSCHSLSRHLHWASNPIFPPTSGPTLWRISRRATGSFFTVVHLRLSGPPPEINGPLEMGWLKRLLSAAYVQIDVSKDEDMPSRGEELRNEPQWWVVATLCLRDEEMQDVEFIECPRMLCEWDSPPMSPVLGPQAHQSCPAFYRQLGIRIQPSCFCVYYYCLVISPGSPQIFQK